MDGTSSKFIIKDKRASMWRLRVFPVVMGMSSSITTISNKEISLKPWIF